MRTLKTALNSVQANIKPIALLSMLLLSPSKALSNDCVDPSEACATVGEWEFQVAVGVGKRTNPLVDSDDIPLVVVPQVSYYGERFFLENLELGYTLTESNHFMLNAILTPGRDSAYFLREDINNFFVDGVLEFSNSIQPGDTPIDADTLDLDDLHKRRLAGLAGFELSSDWAGLQWQLQLLQDITRVHKGQEARFAAGFSSGSQTQRFSASAGLTWKSDAIMNYYYGVSLKEAGPSPLAYEASSGFTSFARLGWQKKLSPRWRLNASVQYEQLSQAMTDSPIVDENKVLQFFIGGLYHF